MSEVEREYKELVELVSKKSLDFDFPNTSIAHAKLVIGKIIETSSETVNIFSRNLKHEIFDNGEVVNSIKANDRVSVNILLEEPDQESNVKFSELKNVKIKTVNEKLKNYDYFIVGDKTKLRVCSRDKPHAAVVNFCQKKKGGELDRIFKEVWDNITVVPS